MSDMVTAEELAKRLSLSAETIRLWAREGIIPAIKITGKVIRYDPADVDRALRERSEQRQAVGAT